jgi:predicted dehydrogenase
VTTAAVIGAGRMGRRHIEMVRQLGLELVGVSDAQPASLALAATQQGVPEHLLFADASAMLTQTTPSCVVVATTAPSHCEYTCLAAERGAKYILCEKPMAVSLAECDQMIRVCARHGARLAVNHQMRFMQQYMEPKRLLASPVFGGLTSVTVVAGNVGMNMNGIHYFEMFRYLTDEPVSSVWAWFSEDNVPNPRGAQFVDRSGSIRLQTPSGKRFYMESGTDQGHGIVVVFAARYGQIIVDEVAVTLRYTARLEEHRQQPTTRYGMPWFEHSEPIAANVVDGSRAVMEALIQDRNYPSGEDGRSAVCSLVAAYVSSESGNTRVDPRSAELPGSRVFPWA